MPKVLNTQQKYCCERNCGLTFATIKQRLNHYRYCRAETPVNANQQLVEPIVIHNSTKQQVEAPLAYNICSSEINSFTNSQLFSMMYQDIVDTYSIPREATRETVKMFNMMLQHNLTNNNIPKENTSCKLLPLDTLSNTMERETPVKPAKYEICIHGCMLYQKGDTVTMICHNCKEPRYTVDGKVRREMKMLPLGQQIAAMLANPRLRDLMKYRSSYQSEPGVYNDYFDGDAYKEMRSQGLFSGEDDVALVMFVDGFTATKGSQSSKLHIVHFINLNLPPEIRYQDNHTFQVAILPGPNNPKSLLDTFFGPILDDLKPLGTSGMVVSVEGVEVCRAKVHLVMATGDLPASIELAHQKSFFAEYGCRICQTKTERKGNHTCFLQKPDSIVIRPKSQFVEPSTDDNLGIKSAPVFCELLSFHGPSFFGLDEMHLLGHGIGKTLYELVTVALAKSSNSARKVVKDDINLSPFYISKSKLIKIGKMIEESKSFVPVTFNSKWVDPVKNSGGNRAVDYLNFLLYQLPTSFVPSLPARSKKAVLNLVTACQLCLKWSITTEELQTIKEGFDNWVLFLKKETDVKNIEHGVLKPTQHYLLHIEYMIKQNGPIKAYSARSMERAIGKYKKLVKSKSSVGENAGNVLVRLANRSYISNLPWSIAEAMNLPSNNPYDETTFINHQDPENHSQLWAPFFTYSISSLPFGITISKITRALQNFHLRVESSGSSAFTLPNEILAAGRAWDTKTFSSQMYADHINEYRRGNCWVMVNAAHISRNNTLVVNWYVGRVLFFFQYQIGSKVFFSALIEMAIENTTSRMNKSIPKVKLNSSVNQSMYSVVRLEDIVCSVGLLKTPNKDWYHVISHRVFTKDLSLTAGSIGMI